LPRIDLVALELEAVVKILIFLPMALSSTQLRHGKILDTRFLYVKLAGPMSRFNMFNTCHGPLPRFDIASSFTQHALWGLMHDVPDTDLILWVLERWPYYGEKLTFIIDGGFGNVL
jgi:hypothetical protein